MHTAHMCIRICIRDSYQHEYGYGNRYCFNFDIAVHTNFHIRNDIHIHMKTDTNLHVHDHTNNMNCKIDHAINTS